MIKKLFNIWRSNSLYRQAVNDFITMLDVGMEMFDIITAKLCYPSGELDLMQPRVYEMDKRINSLEQKIRKEMLTHLVVQCDNSKAQLVSSMILFSLAKDAERIGDYNKNMFEVFQHSTLNPEGLEPDGFRTEIRVLIDKTHSWFKEVKKAFIEQDMDFAYEILPKIKADMDKADEFVVMLVDGEIQNEMAVGYALLLRFLKRILGHQRNILTSIVMPFDKLNYYEINK